MTTKNEIFDELNAARIADSGFAKFGNGSDELLPTDLVYSRYIARNRRLRNFSVDTRRTRVRHISSRLYRENPRKRVCTRRLRLSAAVRTKIRALPYFRRAVNTPTRVAYGM